MGARFNPIKRAARNKSRRNVTRRRQRMESRKDHFRETRLRDACSENSTIVWDCNNPKILETNDKVTVGRREGSALLKVEYTKSKKPKSPHLTARIPRNVYA